MFQKQNRPLPKSHTPDPARSYERSKPSKEADQGQLDINSLTPIRKPDQMEQAVSNRQPHSRQINADNDDIHSKHAAPVDPDLPDDPRPARAAGPQKQ